MDNIPQTVHLIGSWDNFCTALPMDHDLRVGRGVWKGMVTEKGGLEMGHKYTYYVSFSLTEHVSSNPCVIDISISFFLTQKLSYRTQHPHQT